MSAMVFSALRNIGKANITPTQVQHFHEPLRPKDRQRLLRDLTAAPAWMHPHFRQIAREKQ
jgi:hypothetical protein